MFYFQSLPIACSRTKEIHTAIKYSGVPEFTDLPKVLEKVWTMQELTNTQTKF